MSDDESTSYQRDIPFDSQGTDGQLWEVIEIIAEKSKFYKVRWAGFDPQTGKAWSPSWVAKRDCTDDLVIEWNRKKAQKKKQKRKPSKRSSNNAKSHRSAVSSTTEESQMSRNLSTPKQRARSQSLSMTPVARTTVPGRSASIETSPLPNGSVDQPDETVPLPGRKKRKLPVSFGAGPVNKKRKNILIDDEDELILQSFKKTSSTQGGSHKGNGTSHREEREMQSLENDELEYVTPPAVTYEQDLPADGHAPHKRSSQSTPEPNAAYVKYKSGKLSTPQKRRRSSESTRASSTTSDEVEFVAPRHRSVTPPEETSPRLSPWALDRLREFDEWVLPDPAPSLPIETTKHANEKIEDDVANVVRTKVGTQLSTAVDTNAKPSEKSQNGPRSSVVTNGGTNDDSYRRGIVPETQSSQLQEPPQSPVQYPRLYSTHDGNDDDEGMETEPDTGPSKPSATHLQAGPSHGTRPSLYSTPSRSSLIAKMKPRTPGSGTHYSVIDNIEGAFGIPSPEPRLEVVDEEHEDDVESPSLRSSSRPLQPIPVLSPSAFKPHLPSRESTTDGAGSGSSGLDSNNDDEADEVASLIDQFSSPEKQGRRQESLLAKRKGKRRVLEPDDRVVRPKFSSTKDGWVAVTFDSAIEDRDAGRVEEDGWIQVKFENIVQERGKELADRARAERKRQEFERLGVGDKPEKKPLGQVVSAAQAVSNNEEVGDERVLRNPSKGKEKQMSPERDQQQPMLDVVALREEEEETTQDLIMDVDVGADLERNAEPLAQAVEDPVPIPEQPPEDHSERDSAHSKPKSNASAKILTRRHSPEPDFALPPTASAPSAPTPSPPEASAQTQSDPRDYIAILALLNEKSLENAQLMRDIDSLREALASAKSAPQPVDAAHLQELEEMRVSRDQALASLGDSERRVGDLTRGKASAEKDVEFFREQYAKASGFVTAVREENKELEEQAQLARTQAQEGVQMVKATLETRIKALEDDSKAWKRLAMFVMEKDVRTNDDIRRRAAEEPELRARCKELEHFIDLQDEQLNELERNQVQHREETTKLKLELGETKAKLEQALEGAAKGNDLVYRCQWRLENTAVCEGLFSNIEELQEHMFNGGHLQV